MTIRLIFLIMLCIPVACIQYYFLTDTLKDLKKMKKPSKRKISAASEDDYLQRKYLKALR